MIVPYTSVLNVLIQKELGEKRAHWMTALQEYDLEINPVNIVKGQGLCQISAQSNDLKDQCTNWEQQEAIPIGFVNVIETMTSDLYDHIKFFLHNGFYLETLDPKKRRALRLNSTPY